jgi:hypothetical protein
MQTYRTTPERSLRPMTRLAWHQRQIEYLRLDQVVEEAGPKRDVRYPSRISSTSRSPFARRIQQTTAALPTKDRMCPTARDRSAAACHHTGQERRILWSVNARASTSVSPTHDTALRLRVHSNGERASETNAPHTKRVLFPREPIEHVPPHRLVRISSPSGRSIHSLQTLRCESSAYLRRLHRQIRCRDFRCSRCPSRVRNGKVTSRKVEGSLT